MVPRRTHAQYVFCEILTHSILSVHHDFIALWIQEKLQAERFLFKDNHFGQNFQGTGVMPGRGFGDLSPPEGLPHKHDGDARRLASG